MLGSEARTQDRRFPRLRDGSKHPDPVMRGPVEVQACSSRADWPASSRWRGGPDDRHRGGCGRLARRDSSSTAQCAPARAAHATKPVSRSRRLRCCPARQAVRRPRPRSPSSASKNRAWAPTASTRTPSSNLYLFGDSRSGKTSHVLALPLYARSRPDTRPRKHRHLHRSPPDRPFVPRVLAAYSRAEAIKPDLGQLRSFGTPSPGDGTAEQLADVVVICGSFKL